MGVPTSEVGYTAAMFRRGDHEAHKDMWWGHWTQKKLCKPIVFAVAVCPNLSALFSSGEVNVKVHPITGHEGPNGKYIAILFL